MARDHEPISPEVYFRIDKEKFQKGDRVWFVLQVEDGKLKGRHEIGQSETGVYQIDLKAEGIYDDGTIEVPHWDGRYHYLLRDLDDDHIAPGWLFPYVDRLLKETIKVQKADGEEDEKECVALFRGDNSASWWEKQQDDS